MHKIEIQTVPFTGQKPGTSGLRKKVTEFQQTHYLENFVQAIFNAIGPTQGETLIIGGDGRYYNSKAIQIIIKMAAANGFAKLLIGQDGILSTPAASCLIRKYKTFGGVILSASHNPGGPTEDFGIKFNGDNGGPATESVTDKIYSQTLKLNHYFTLDRQDINLSELGTHKILDTEVEVIDPVTDYADMMMGIFDFDKIKSLLERDDFKLSIDAMHAVNGPYATEIIEHRLGACKGSVINAIPLTDFGGGHPDPNLVHAHELVSLINEDQSMNFAAAFDGDGDRNLLLGHNFYINPCDSLAVITANAHLIPGYASGISGVARSMPTSRAVDRVASVMNIHCYETPTGWKFFGNLLDAKKITFCGEESFGTGSSHIREKDGLWAVLFWLNLIAEKSSQDSNTSVKKIVEEHWRQFGRDYFTRHDYESIDSSNAQNMFSELKEKLNELEGRKFNGLNVISADNFQYCDPVDGSVTKDQGVRIFLENDSRIVYRLSGTGTAGATLRLYIDQYDDNPDMEDNDPQKVLSKLIIAADEIAGIREFTGRKSPDVIT